MAAPKKTAKAAKDKSTKKGSASRTTKKSQASSGSKTTRTSSSKSAQSKKSAASTSKSTAKAKTSTPKKPKSPATKSKGSTSATKSKKKSETKAKTQPKAKATTQTAKAKTPTQTAKAKTAATQTAKAKTTTQTAKAKTATKTKANKTSPAKAKSSSQTKAKKTSQPKTQASTQTKAKKTTKTKTKTPAKLGAQATANGKAARPTLERLIELGREVMGIKDLRPGQAEAFEHILAGRDVLAVMPTGSGKSLLYQLPSLVLPGLTVVVSPLIALIKDQIDKMKAVGVAVCRVDSTITVKQKREMEKLVRSPGGKLLLTTPERMANPEFRAFLRESAEGVGVSLFVVDEAHCVSQWGHDFRPSYLGLRKALEDLGRPPVLSTTATAPPHVRDDILHQLGMEDARTVTITFDRPNLHYECIAVPGDDDKNRVLLTLLKKLPRPGIVYCATVKTVESLYEKLYRHGIPVAKYHGRLTKKVRDEEQARFMAKKSDLVMIATNAFGLGVDKRDIRYVLHYHVPGSLEQYAQEAGRGGRDDKPARCVLLFSPDDVAIQEYFLKGTYPTRRQVRAVYNTLDAWSDHEETPPTVANLALGSRVGTSRTRTVLSLLKDEGFVLEREGGLFELPDPEPDSKLLNEKAKQYEARRVADRQRLDALLDYVGTPGCRSQVILSYLGEEDPEECGRCDNCLRSKEAALAAAREAYRLEDGLVRKLQEEDAVDGVPEKRRVIRARVIRIDGPEQEGAPEGGAKPAAGERGAANGAGARAQEAAAPGASEGDEDEEQQLARLAAEQRADDEDEYEYEEYDEDDEDEDDEYEYEYEDEDDYEVEEIEKTAAALAEEGLELEDSEITILARKRVPKQPKKKRSLAAEEDQPKKRRRRRRRRRRKKSALPPKSAFTSPVLTKDENENGRERQAPEPRRPAPVAEAGPLVEYVRGPMRINMTPVASATPNDVAPHARKGKKKRRPPRQGSGAAPSSSSSASSASPPASKSQPAEPSGKKRRRRRRRRKKGGGAASEEGPITFFSVEESRGGKSSNGEGSNGRKRRRRRRRRGGGKSRQKQNAGSSAPKNDTPSSGSNDNSEITDA